MGEEYPDTTSVGDLASSLVRQGKNVEAEEMLQASLVARRRVLGNAHPHTLITGQRLDHWVGHHLFGSFVLLKHVFSDKVLVLDGTSSS
jgi:hypothetical protein